MQIHQEIIEAYPLNNQIVVRFTTDIATAQHLCLIPNQENPELPPARCSTDRAITLPLPVPTGEALQTLIMTACDWGLLEREERRILDAQTPDLELQAARDAISSMLGSTFSVIHPGTVVETEEMILEKNLAKIDADVDVINLKAAGLRTVEYTMAEEAAQSFKDAGYVGIVSPLISIWTSKNGKGLTTDAQAADDILGQAAAWRGAVEAMRIQRLSRKKDLHDGVPTAMAQWNGFVTALRSQLFPPNV